MYSYPYLMHRMLPSLLHSMVKICKLPNVRAAEVAHIQVLFSIKMVHAMTALPYI